MLSLFLILASPLLFASEDSAAILTVSVVPAELSGKAAWKVGEGAWRTPEHNAELAAGSYRLQARAVAGYVTPDAQVIELEAGDSLTVTLIYTQSLARAATPSRADLSGVSSFGCWLAGIDVPTLVNSPFDLVVIDYSADGGANTAFTAAEVQQIRGSGKIVLAYFSIGEAEDYRFYWRESWRPGRPRFLGPENPNWEGNFKVRYWEYSWWKRVVRPYLGQIMKAGFDGVYLDIVDAYYFWGSKRGISRRRAADQMVTLVERIAIYGRKRDPDFIVCPQNAVLLLAHASRSRSRSYLRMIDCVGMESVFYDSTNADRELRLRFLKRIGDAGKPILNIEYITPAQYDEYDSILAAQILPIIGYAAADDQNLDELIIR